MCPPSSPSRDESWKIFERIAPRYDFLNHFLSGGQDLYWRWRVSRMARTSEGARVLDLATGTGDQLFALARRAAAHTFGIGIDRSLAMLRLGQRKLAKHQRRTALSLIQGEAACLPIHDGAIDVVTVVFGIRNCSDLSAVLREIHRILKRDGQLIVLEFGLPNNRFWRALYLFYFRHLLPPIGAVVSGDAYAYRYLNETVETFPYGDHFAEALNHHGFQTVETVSLTGGIAWIYHVKK